MADDDAGQPKNPQPANNLPERINDAIRAWAKRGLGMIQAPATHIEDGHSGQLAPPHSPTARDAGGGQPSGWLRARHPAASPPPSITESILRDPGRYQSPEPEPEPGHDTGREQ